jgi:hypothetical protein
LISVDLPAPFSPQSAWTSPCAQPKLTSSSARTPENVLLMFSISKANGARSTRSLQFPFSSRRYSAA